MTLSQTEKNDVLVMLCELYAYAFTGHQDAIVDTLADLEHVLGVNVSDKDVQTLVAHMKDDDSVIDATR